MKPFEIPVMLTSKEVVPPKYPTVLEHMTPLSNLDLLIPKGFHVGVYFCYKKQPQLSTMGGNMVRALLREALAETLSSFYVFAGEVVENSRGEPESLCNNRGVDFLHAFADTELKDIDFFRLDFSIQGKFIPVLRRGVFSAQVTELRCGGLVIGCVFDHRVADAYSANMFLRSWAENARQKPTIFYGSPNANRSLLNPRTPLRYPKSIDKWYTIGSPNDGGGGGYDHLHLRFNPEEDHHTSRTFYIEAEEIKKLQEQACSDSGQHRTKYEAFTSFLWKTLAHSLKDERDKFRMSIAVDGRTRLFHDGQDNGAAAFMARNYFGNVLSFPFVDARAKDLKEMTLGKAADLVHECKVTTTRSEHFFGLIDWIEMQKPSQPATRIVNDKAEVGATILVSSGLGFSILEMDFGWGKPSFGSCHNPYGAGIGGYVMTMPSAKGNGDWVVYVHLMNKQVDLLEGIPHHVLKPLVPAAAYLDL